MTKILYIAASPRGAMSQSGKLAETYLAARQAGQPDISIDRLDLCAPICPSSTATRRWRR